MCLRALPTALQVDSFLLFNFTVGKAKETGERGRGVGSGQLGGPELPKLTLGPLPVPGPSVAEPKDVSPHAGDITLPLPAPGDPWPCTPQGDDSQRNPEQERAWHCLGPNSRL